VKSPLEAFSFLNVRQSEETCKGDKIEEKNEIIVASDVDIYINLCAYAVARQRKKKNPYLMCTKERKTSDDYDIFSKQHLHCTVRLN